jgi:hypothetical protein
MKPEMKLLWQWLLDRCDNAGVIDPDLDLASFQIGYQYPMDTLLGFDQRVVKLPGGKWFIPKFIGFQYGKLSLECKAHNPIFQSLSKNGIDPQTLAFERVSKGYPKGIHTLQEKEKKKDKEKEKEKEAQKSKSRGAIEELKSFAAEIGLSEMDGESMFHHWEANGWKNGSNPVKDWQAGMRKWKSAGWLPSQKANPQKPHRKNEYPQENLQLPD